MTLTFQERPDPRIRQRFDFTAGWRYGLILGIALVLVGWGPDALALSSASFEFFWAKIALAALLFIPLTVIASTLAARANNSTLLRWLVWGIWGILVGVTAGYLPFTGQRFVATLLDPVVSGLPIFVSTAETRFLAGFTAFWGIVLSLPAALLQIFAIGRGWDRSTTDGRFSWASWAFLLLALPLAIVMGYLCDYFNNATLRQPPLLLDRVIQLALHAPPDLEASKLPQREMLEYFAGVSWRSQMTPRFTQYLADIEPETFQSASLDVVFDNGFIWRCSTTAYAQFVAGCWDVTPEYRDAVAGFLKTGTAYCPDCTMQVEPAAANWQKAHVTELGGTPSLSVAHHAGGAVFVRAQFAAGPTVECHLVGADPVRILDCSGG